MRGERAALPRSKWALVLRTGKVTASWPAEIAPTSTSAIIGHINVKQSCERWVGQEGGRWLGREAFGSDQARLESQAQPRFHSSVRCRLSAVVCRLPA